MFLFKPSLVSGLSSEGRRVGDHTKGICVSGESPEALKRLQLLPLTSTPDQGSKNVS